MVNSFSIARVIIITSILSFLALIPSYTYSHEHQHVEPGKIAPSNSLTLINRPIHHIHESHPIIIDLSHPLDNKTIHWPTNSGFSYSVQKNGYEKNGIYIKSDTISTAIHTGTHMDSPNHFSENGTTIEGIPLYKLINIPIVAIDLSPKIKSNRSYSFTKADFIDSHGESLVKPHSVVLVYTGISDFYSQGEKAYYGTDDPKDAHQMKIPGFSKEAAEYLVSQDVYGVGLDSPSADSSDRHAQDGSFDAVAHSQFCKNNVYILENVNGRLKDLLGHKSARLIVAPLPIVSGSGSPVRLTAVLNDDDCNCQAHNSAEVLTNRLGPLASILFALGATAFLL